MQEDPSKILAELVSDTQKNEDTQVSDDDYKKVLIQQHREDIADQRQDRKLRTLLGDKIYAFVSLYMFAVFFILLLSGMPNVFRLSDTVLVTLLGTTTANVIGVFMVVTTYYFYRSKK